jgi:hypothetical protein
MCRQWLTPLVNILPAQLFAYHLTLAKQYDTEHPRSIRKVTDEMNDTWGSLRESIGGGIIRFTVIVR